MLMARRLIEAGVRLVHVQWPRMPGDNAVDNPLWDTHSQHFDRMEDVLCPIFDVGFSAVKTNTVQFRPDLWVLPFLNVYGLFGYGTNTIDVTLARPFEAKTRVDRTAALYGFGGNISAGISRYFVVVDGNLSWADVEGLDSLTRANTISGRVGRSFRLSKQMRIAGWIGAMRLGVETATSGSVRVGDVLPGLEDFFENYQDSDWYNDLTLLQQRTIDRLFAEIIARDPQNSTVQYAIDKALASQWSVVIGGQFQFNANWMFRYEYMQSDSRGAMLLNLNYRFGGF